jgi:hypothetical protein
MNQERQQWLGYLLGRLFDLLANATSIRRRMASEREGLSGC